MRDAASQAADRIHFLGLRQLRFQAHALGEIASIRYEVSNGSRRVAYRRDTFFHVIELSILLAVFRNAAINISRENCLPQFLIDAGARCTTL